MNRFQATSRCECQALLTAILDEKRHVIEGSAIYQAGGRPGASPDDAGGRPDQGARETAPAHSIGAENEHFDIGWLCPFCGRNTLRTFYAGALRALPVANVAVAMGAPAPKPPDAPVKVG